MGVSVSGTSSPSVRLRYKDLIEIGTIHRWILFNTMLTKEEGRGIKKDDKQH